MVRLRSCWIWAVSVVVLTMTTFGGLWLLGSLYCSATDPTYYQAHRDDGPLMVVFALKAMAVAAPELIAVVAFVAVWVKRNFGPGGRWRAEQEETDMQPADRRVTRWTLISAAILVVALLLITWFWGH
jgi:hypothetical protein